MGEKNVKLLTLVLALTLLSTVACGSGAPPQGQPSTSKLLPPLEVSMLVDESRLSIGTDLPISIVFIPSEQVSQELGQLEASGVISLVNVPVLQWNNPAVNEPVTTQATFRIEGFGEGAIKFLVQAVDKSGVTQYGRATYLYFLATEQGIITGTASPWLLKKEYLDRALANGNITQQEYDEALEQLLGGGATESNEPLTTPG